MGAINVAPAQKSGNIRSVGEQKNKIFISWSGLNTREFAKGLKMIIEDKIFPGTGLQCFVSIIDIASGTDWWPTISGELRTCNLGILCITTENVAAPWIFYEAGGMAAREVPSIPLLINCKLNALADSPLQGKQCVNFGDRVEFIKMIEDINNRFNKLLPPAIVSHMAGVAYDELNRDLAFTIEKLRNIRTFNSRNIYPQKITSVKLNTVYLSVPMASIREEEYILLHEHLLGLKNILEDIGFTDIYSSALDIDKKDSFDGKIKAMRDNFAILKEVDSILVIYPWKCPSSALVDIGYGIALCKKMVIFYKEGLPYMLEEAGQYIKHVRTYHFENYAEIDKIIKSNGIDLFEGE